MAATCREKLDGLDVKVVSRSVDDEDTAHELIAKHGLTFPVGHSADAVAIHEATGAVVTADPVHLRSTGFVIDPDGHVVVSVDSSGAIGRLMPEDVAGLVNYLKSVTATTVSASPPAQQPPVEMPSF
jgi:alkyl hydroperoxide reductase subunit AhpC